LGPEIGDQGVDGGNGLGEEHTICLWVIVDG
jgi:hypothetical protein